MEEKSSILCVHHEKKGKLLISKLIGNWFFWFIGSKHRFEMKLKNRQEQVSTTVLLRCGPNLLKIAYVPPVDLQYVPFFILYTTVVNLLFQILAPLNWSRSGHISQDFF